MSLTKRENEFCRYYASCRNGREAAARAGFAFPERSGLRLLDKESVKTEIERLTANTKGISSAVDGLKRLAFGSVTDAVRLVLAMNRWISSRSICTRYPKLNVPTRVPKSNSMTALKPWRRCWKQAKVRPTMKAQDLLMPFSRAHRQ